MVGFKSSILLFAFYLSHLHFVPFFFFVCLLLVQLNFLWFSFTSFIDLLAVTLVIWMIALVLILYIFNYHRVTSSSIPPFHIQCKTLKIVCFHFFPSPLCAIVVIHLFPYTLSAPQYTVIIYTLNNQLSYKEI